MQPLDRDNAEFRGPVIAGALAQVGLRAAAATVAASIVGGITTRPWLRNA